MLGIVMMFGLSACGIKAPPVPPPPPDIDLKRIGEYIYIKPKHGEILKVEGFEKKGNIFVKKDKSSSCFEVKDKTHNTSATYCVPPAILRKPVILKAYRKFRIHLKLSGFKRYRIYKHPAYESFNPFKPYAETSSNALLPPDFSSFCLSITGIINDEESMPNLVCFKETSPPIPSSPKNLNFMVYKNKIYLYWEPNEDNGYTIGYLVYKNGKLLTKKPIHSNVFVDRLPKAFTIYKVQAVSEFNTKSKPSEIQITLKALKQALGL